MLETTARFVIKELIYKYVDWLFILPVSAIGLFHVTPIDIILSNHLPKGIFPEEAAYSRLFEWFGFLSPQRDLVEVYARFTFIYTAVLAISFLAIKMVFRKNWGWGSFAKFKLLLAAVLYFIAVTRISFIGDYLDTIQQALLSLATMFFVAIGYVMELGIIRLKASLARGIQNADL